MQCTIAGWFLCTWPSLLGPVQQYHYRYPHIHISEWGLLERETPCWGVNWSSLINSPRIGNTSRLMTICLALQYHVNIVNLELVEWNCTSGWSSERYRVLFDSARNMCGLPTNMSWRACCWIFALLPFSAPFPCWHTQTDKKLQEILLWQKFSHLNLLRSTAKSQAVLSHHKQLAYSRNA